MEITSGAKENLIKNVREMKLNVSKSGTVKDSRIQGKKKFRYNNKGYCKYLEKSKFQHFTHICDQFQKDGKSESGPGCQFRHPTVCNYSKNDTKGCKRDKA